jgi:hypothetical protein
MWKVKTPVFKNTKFRVGKTKIQFEKPAVLVQNPEVSGKIFELKTSVKAVFRNASVAETRNFELLLLRNCYFVFRQMSRDSFKMAEYANFGQRF